jgi:hypothetical protein
MALDDATVNIIAAETEDARQERARFIHKQKSLNVAYLALRSLDQSRISGRHPFLHDLDARRC